MSMSECGYSQSCSELPLKRLTARTAPPPEKPTQFNTHCGNTVSVSGDAWHTCDLLLRMLCIALGTRHLMAQLPLEQGRSLTLFTFRQNTLEVCTILDTTAAHSLCSNLISKWDLKHSVACHLLSTLGMEAAVCRACTDTSTGFPVHNHIYSGWLFPRPWSSISSKGPIIVTTMFSSFMDLKEERIFINITFMCLLY